MITAQEIQKGKALAESAGLAMYQRIGERDACGFGWVEVYVDRTNSKQAQELIKAGFRKDYTGALTLWNPSGFPTQSISILEAGAEAYAEVIKTKLGLDKVYAGSRLD